MVFVVSAGTKTDTLYTSGGAYLTRLSTPAAGITRVNIDTSKTRHATADSATIPVLKGHTTKRDSTTFTGGIRGVRLSMDSIFNLTGTAGYVQYLSNSKKLINAPMYTNGANVSVGKGSVEAWSTGNFALQIGGASAILTKASEVQNGTYYMNNAYNDNSGFKPYVNGAAAMYSTSSADGNHAWFSNTGLTADIVFTPTVAMSLSSGGVLNIPSLTASRAVVTDGSKNIISSPTTATELALLSGKNSVIDGSGAAGYVPFFSEAKRLGNSPIFTDGSNIAVGKNSVITWQTDKKAIQIGNNAAIMTSKNSGGGTYLWLLGNMYYDTTGTWKPHNDGVAWMLRNGDNGWSFYFNSGLTANIAFNPASIMSLSTSGILNLPSLTASRAVITDESKNIISSPTTSTELALLSGKNSVIDGSGTAGNIPVFTGTGRIGNGPAYETGSFPCTLKTSDVTVQQIGTAYWTKIGNVFTCSFPYLSGTSNSTLLRMYCSIPYKPKQMSGSSNVDNRAIPAVDNGSSIVCFVDVFQVSGFIAFQNSGGVFTNSGIKSVLPFSVTYITED